MMLGGIYTPVYVYLHETEDILIDFCVLIENRLTQAVID